MPARKKRPVLYEVVARTQRARGRVPWSIPRPARPASSAADSLFEPASAAEPEAQAAAPSESVGLVGGRMYLVVGWPHALVAAALLAAFLWGAFQVGRISASPPEPPGPGIADMLSGTPPADVIRPGGGSDARTPVTPANPDAGRGAGARKPDEPPSPSPSPSPQTPRFEPQPGRYYVVIQHFARGKQQEAEAARDFLRGKGVECAVQAGASGTSLLVATRPFDSKAAADGLIRQVKELGKEYFPVGWYKFENAQAEVLRS